jgi:hypothetical protein
MEGQKEKSQRPHRSPNATPEDVIRKTEESRRMEGSGGHAVAGDEAVRQGGRCIACYGIPELLRLFRSAMEFHSR